MTYDVARVRAHFPQLSSAAYFDGPGGSQTPDVVARAIHDTLLAPLSNRGRLTEAERNADQVVLGFRSAMADLLGAEPGGIVYGRSFTQLTFDVSRAMAKEWGPGDEVVVSRLDHDSNVRPWVIAAEAVGATVRWADFDPETAELTADDVDAVLTNHTKVVAVTGASNLIGTRPDLAAIAERVHDAGAWLYVDAVHLTPHAPVSLAESGADFVGCSAYKFLGPHCGTLAGRVELLERLRPDKLVPASDQVPERFELGTLPYELMAGATAAVDFLAGLAPGDATTRRTQLESSMTALAVHEDGLRERVEARLAELPGVTVHSRAARRTPTTLATFAGHDARDLAGALAERGINAPAGTFYAYEPAQRIALGPDGGLRIGMAPYTDDSDIDRLLEALTELLS
jgi:cysteine desulfurase family protein (TIGR01976 family)